MKKIYAIVSAALLLASCADFTDLKPKGMNMLSSADELELLLNAEFRDFNRIFDFFQLPGDVLPGPVGNVANLLSMPTPSRNSILVQWDESYVQRLAELTTSDDDYTKLFGFVGQISTRSCRPSVLPRAMPGRSNRFRQRLCACAPGLSSCW